MLWTDNILSTAQVKRIIKILIHIKYYCGGWGHHQGRKHQGQTLMLLEEGPGILAMQETYPGGRLVGSLISQHYTSFSSGCQSS